MNVQLSPRALYSPNKHCHAEQIANEVEEEVNRTIENAGKRMREIDPDGSEAIALFNEHYNRRKNSGAAEQKNFRNIPD
jgi:hypothetical protein